ncbi:hypothetical protein IL306_014459 [Fusarium sp. DS 682]|nr:hypothetical protein IL306_014459 [Fusarium sp. DS 682]
MSSRHVLDVLVMKWKSNSASAIFREHICEFDIVDEETGVADVEDGDVVVLSDAGGGGGGGRVSAAQSLRGLPGPRRGVVAGSAKTEIISGGEVCGAESSLEGGCGAKSQGMPKRTQLAQAGFTSSHWVSSALIWDIRRLFWRLTFTFLLLQLKHPFLDLRCGLLASLETRVEEMLSGPVG